MLKTHEYENAPEMIGWYSCPECGHREAYLPEIIGGSYGAIWRSKKRYLVVKGSRASKKSCTVALNIIYRIMNEPLTNAVVIRRYFNTHRDSTFAQLKWAINRLGVRQHWKETINPLAITYLPTGQKILFRGFDDPQSITSITAEKGYLNLVWIEEAFQISDEKEFDKLDMSIRGYRPEGYYNQIIMTMNPWSATWWGKARFFDEAERAGGNHPLIDTFTTNYMCNEFLSEADLTLYENMKQHNPNRYQIEGLGEWGIAEGLIYQNWQEQDFDEFTLRKKLDSMGRPIYTEYYGLDWGYSNDPTAIVKILANAKTQEIFVCDEVYLFGASNDDIFKAIKDRGWENCLIYADSSDPRTNSEMRIKGVKRLRAVSKKKIGGINYVIAGIQKLQDFKIYVHPKCVNMIIELNLYRWDVDKNTGRTINMPIDESNHLCDSLRYAASTLARPNFSF
jgi:phage terminase large subunit